jgi:hypothetical protein
LSTIHISIKFAAPGTLRYKTGLLFWEDAQRVSGVLTAWCGIQSGL